jgi:hypothetical protein
MKIIRTNLFYFILWSIFFVIFTIFRWSDSSSNQMIENNISNDRNRRTIIGLRQSLVTPRRNQACLFLNDSILINIAGQKIHTIEFQDLHSGVIRNVYNKHLDIHHHVALLHNGEIWLPCGLSGNNVNSETSLKHMLIVNIQTGNVRRGPKLRYPRGLCGAVIVSKMIINKENIQSIVVDQSQRIDLNISKWTEDVICILGGSIGQHDTGNLTSLVECYSERARGWLVLPSLPVQLDHLVAHIYNHPFENESTIRIIPTESNEDQVLVAVGGRTENVGDERREIYTMSLSSGYWTLAAKMIEQRSAFASCLFDNRYIIIAGGISYRHPEASIPIILSDIEICDMLTGKCHVSNAHLQTDRFDTTGCSTKELCYICGGTTNGSDNLDSCESFIKHDLLDIVER